MGKRKTTADAIAGRALSGTEQPGFSESGVNYGSLLGEHSIRRSHTRQVSKHGSSTTRTPTSEVPLLKLSSVCLVSIPRYYKEGGREAKGRKVRGGRICAAWRPKDPWLGDTGHPEQPTRQGAQDATVT